MEKKTYYVNLLVTNPDSQNRHPQTYSITTTSLEQAIHDAKFQAKFNWRVGDSSIEVTDAGLKSVSI